MPVVKEQAVGDSGCLNKRHLLTLCQQKLALCSALCILWIMMLTCSIVSHRACSVQQEYNAPGMIILLHPKYLTP